MRTCVRQRHIPGCLEEPATRQVIQMVIKVVENIHKSPLQTSRSVTLTSVSNSTQYIQCVNAVSYRLAKTLEQVQSKGKWYFEACASQRRDPYKRCFTWYDYSASCHITTRKVFPKIHPCAQIIDLSRRLIFATMIIFQTKVRP